MPTISVIVPIYNIQDEILIKNIQSLINQTFSDIEIILVNDGSTNNALEVCNSFKNDKRIKILSKENGGVSTARNLGLEKASGKWIMFVDADDFVSLDIAEKLLSEADDSYDIISSGCVVELKNRTENVHFFKGDKVFSTTNDKKILYKQLMKGITGQPGKNYYTAIGVPWGKLYKKSFLDENGLKFDASLKRMQDNIFNMRAFYAAKNIKYTDICLYHYDYSHMDDYKKRYNPEIQNYLKNVVIEREKAIKELGLYSDPELREYYLNEKLRLLAHIETRVPLNKRNNLSFAERRKLAKNIAMGKEFQEIYTAKNKGFVFKHGTNCIGFYLLTKLRLWGILTLFSK